MYVCIIFKQTHATFEYPIKYISMWMHVQVFSIIPVYRYYFLCLQTAQWCQYINFRQPITPPASTGEEGQPVNTIRSWSVQYMVALTWPLHLPNPGLCPVPSHPWANYSPIPTDCMSPWLLNWFGPPYLAQTTQHDTYPRLKYQAECKTNCETCMYSSIPHENDVYKCQKIISTLNLWKQSRDSNGAACERLFIIYLTCVYNAQIIFNILSTYMPIQVFPVKALKLLFPCIIIVYSVRIQSGNFYSKTNLYKVF